MTTRPLEFRDPRRAKDLRAALARAVDEAGGDVAIMHVWPSGPPAMGKLLAGWFVYSLLVSLVVAYVVSRTLPADAHYLAVFRLAGTAAFLAYAGAAPIESIWFARNWSSTFKKMIDGLIYALLTAGTFGWLAA